MELRETNNFRIRKENVDMIIVHSMGEYVGGKFAPEFLESKGLSAHYFIKPNGNIIKSIEEPNEFVMFHAGTSEWKDQSNLNENSIGIELLIEGDHNWSSFREAIKEKESFTERHYQSLEFLCSRLMKTNPLISIDRILEHSTVSGKDVRPDNPKVDPGEGWNHEFFKSMLRQPLEQEYISDKGVGDKKKSIIMSNIEYYKNKLKKLKKILF